MAKKTPKQVKPKTGLARCMELASNKKGLIFISAILSSLASIASFIPYIAVYFIIRSILQVYPNLNSLDVNEVIGYGWLALGGIIANILLYFLAIFCSHLAAFGTLYELKVKFAEHITKIPFDNDNVTFDNVSFSYTGKENELAIKNVSFEAKQGEITAIVGL